MGYRVALGMRKGDFEGFQGEIENSGVHGAAGMARPMLLVASVTLPETLPETVMYFVSPEPGHTQTGANLALHMSPYSSFQRPYITICAPRKPSLSIPAILGSSFPCSPRQGARLHSLRT